MIFNNHRTWHIQTHHAAVAQFGRYLAGSLEYFVADVSGSDFTQYKRFDLQAVDYLLKPISFERLLQAINKYLNESKTEQADSKQAIIDDDNDYIFVRSDRKMIKIDFCDIKFIESLSDYIKIHLSDKTIITRETITNIEAKLPQQKFLRTHRSYIVSISNIESFTNEYIEIGINEIPLSRSYKESVLKRLENK